jgi:uracil-DNA glycosylase
LHAQLFDQLHSDWKSVLKPHQNLIEAIEQKLMGVEITPEFANVFRALSRSIDSTHIVIFGQDPYPTAGHAHGLAFSVDSSVVPLPPSLRNIYAELATDCAVTRTQGDLSDWFDQGVMLINRILTTEKGASLAHADYGWQQVTDAVAEELGKRDVVAVLWGKSAGELAHYFRSDLVIESVHPSPLSAYRGFFSSKPFSRCNELLISRDKKPIVW